MVNTKVILGNTLNGQNVLSNLTNSTRIEPGGLLLPGRYQNQKCMIPISKECLARDMFIIGGIGSGKTNVFQHVLYQLRRHMNTEDVLIVFDPKKDFRSFHKKNDCVISNDSVNGLPSSSADWNIFMEVIADGWEPETIFCNANEIAELIFVDAIKESQAPFFPKAAKDIFAAILCAMSLVGKDDVSYRIQYMNNQALRKYIESVDALKLRQFLGQFLRLKGVLKYIGDGSSDQALGVLAEFQAVTSKLFQKGFGQDGRFGVRFFSRERGGRALFVEYDLASGMTFQSIYRILIDLFLKEALSETGSAKSKGKVYVVCDELKLLPKLTHLQDALNFGRSLGITVIAGIQSMEQLYEAYGETIGKNIASAFQNVLGFYTNNKETRDYIRSIYGTNVSVVKYADGNNRLIAESREGHVVEDWDLTNLQCGEAIVGLPYQTPFQFQFDLFQGNTQ